VQFGVLTSLHKDESRIIFWWSRIKFLQVSRNDIRPQYVSLHAVNDAEYVIARPWTATADWALPTRRQLPLKFRVVSDLSRAPSFMTSQLPACVCVVCLLKALVHVHCTL